VRRVKNPKKRRYYTIADCMEQDVYKAYLSLVKEFGERGAVRTIP
jgi:thymidylate kinase